MCLPIESLYYLLKIIGRYLVVFERLHTKSNCFVFLRGNPKKYQEGSPAKCFLQSVDVLYRDGLVKLCCHQASGTDRGAQLFH